MEFQDLKPSRIQTHNVEQSFISSGSNVCASSSIMDCMASSCSPPSSTLLGDYIGIESCLDLKDNDDIFVSSSSRKEKEISDQSFNLRRSRRDRKLASKKEFPPPIPLLARTGNLPCHMPWVLQRYYTSDGRLILKEERVRHHGYFRAQRCNGRLTLQLVPLDDEADNIYPPHYSSSIEEEDNNENELEQYCPIQEADQIEQEKQKEENDQLENFCNENGKDLKNILNEEDEEEKEKCLNAEEKEKEKIIEKGCNDEEEGDEDGEAENLEFKGIKVNNNGGDEEEDKFDDECAKKVHAGKGIIIKKEILYDQNQRSLASVDNGNSGNIGGNVSAFKCFNYNRMNMMPGSTCIFEMPVPAMRPIHS